MLEAPSQLNILNVGRPALPPEVALQFDDYTASWSRDTKSLTLDAINISVKKVTSVILLIIKTATSSLLLISH